VVRQTLEPLEDPGALARRDPRAVVTDHEDRDEPPDAPVDLDVAALRRELQRVCDQVREDLLDASAVAGRNPEPRRQRGREVDAAVDRDGQQTGGHLTAGLGDGERSELDVDRPGLESRELEQVADEVGHRGRDRPAALQEVALGRGVRHLVAEDELEIATDPGEGRSELVSDGRHERRPLDVPRPQPGEIALVGELRRDQRERDGGVPGHRRWQTLREDILADGPGELEAEGHVARRGDRQDREVAILILFGRRPWRSDGRRRRLAGATGAVRALGADDERDRRPARRRASRP